MNTENNTKKRRKNKLDTWIRAMYAKYNVIIRQSMRFGIIGVANTAIDFGLFTGLCYVMPYATAQVISFCSAMVFSFFMNRRWTFKERRRIRFRQAASFVGVNMASLLVSLGVLTICMESFGLSNTLAKVIAMPFSLTVNFLGNRLIVFKAEAQNGNLE